MAAAKQSLIALALLALAGATPLGPFEGESDIGSVVPPGTAAFDPATGTYTLSASGTNLWYRADGFHFVWKKVSGDAALQADVTWPPTAYDHPPIEHRKAVLIFRQSLDPDSPYVDAAPHGNGIVALQWRREKGANTEDIEVNLDRPRTVRLEKRGDEFTMLVSFHGEPLHRIGAGVRLHLDGTFYAGLGLTSHDEKTTDVAAFAHVTLEPPAPYPAARPTTWSTLKVIQTEDPFRRAMMIRTARGTFEGPSVAPDGSYLLINEKGALWKVPLLDPKTPHGGDPVPFDLGPLKGCWGEHGFSPDGKWLAVSCSLPGESWPDVFVVPAAGGSPRRLTHRSIAYFRGWSPDSKTVVFASKKPDGPADLFTVAVDTGAVTQLTHGSDNDGAEYTRDGAWIYFNSDRSGTMQLWRMTPGGAGPERVTRDDTADWYPHIAPDGKQIVFLAYDKDVMGHAPNKPVALMLLDPATGAVRKLTELFGGQGSLDSNSWLDKNHLGFTSYEILPEGTP